MLTGLSRFWFSGPRIDRAEPPPVGRAGGPPGRIGRAGRAARAARPDDALPPGRRPPDRGHRPRLPRRLRLEGLPAGRARSAGSRCPAGLRESERLPEPLFTPSTKAEVGHDENIDLDRGGRGSSARDMARAGRATSRSRCTGAARRSPEPAGIILADTKFEFGIDRETGELLLIDEVLTPDSSRFWDAAAYEPGRAAGELRQAVRPRLARDAGVGQDAARPGAARRRRGGTRARYVEAFERITGAQLRRLPRPTTSVEAPERGRPLRGQRRAEGRDPRPAGPGGRGQPRPPRDRGRVGRPGRAAGRADRHRGRRGRGAGRRRAARRASSSRTR